MLLIQFDHFVSIELHNDMFLLLILLWIFRYKKLEVTQDQVTSKGSTFRAYVSQFKTVLFEKYQYMLEGKGWQDWKTFPNMYDL